MCDPNCNINALPWLPTGMEQRVNSKGVANEGVMSTAAIENVALGIGHKENILMTKWYFKKPERLSERNILSQHPTLFWENTSCVQTHIQLHLEEAGITSSFPFPAEETAMWLIHYTSLLILVKQW